MKLAISNIAWSNDNNQNIYEYLKQKNIKYLEIAPTKIVGENPYTKISLLQKEAKNLKEKYDLKIISMQSIWYGIKENIFESEESANKLIDYTKKAIDFASSIDCHNLVFGCPRNRNMLDQEKDYKKALAFFKKIGEYAQEKNVVIAVEPNPIIYNTNFLNYTQEALNFVKQVNLPSVKINYDLGTVIYNGESFNPLKEDMDYVNHIHISNPNLLLIEENPLYKELLKILKESNYSGYVSIEMKEHSSDEVKKVLDYICKMCEDVENEI